MRVIVNGFMGGLGGAIIRIAAEVGAEIAAGADKRAAANTCNQSGSGKPEDSKAAFPIFNDIACCDATADVIIECASAGSVGNVMAYATNMNLPVVVCTTGLTPEDEESVIKASTKIPILKSANLSIGVGIVREALKSIAPAAAAQDFDIEITEKHHNKKRDAPSGTALMLANTINTATGGRYEYVYGRSGASTRNNNELGIHSMRGGTIFGEHSIIFAGFDEVIEIKHTALSKDIFARGALKAAKYLTSGTVLEPGLYGMEELSI